MSQLENNHLVDVVSGWIGACVTSAKARRGREGAMRLRLHEAPIALMTLGLVLPGCQQDVQMRVANDKPNDLRIELGLPGGGAPTLDRVRVLAIPADGVLWEASGPAAEIDEISYGDAPAEFNEVSPAVPLAAGGQVLVKVSGDGVRGELQLFIKED